MLGKKGFDLWADGYDKSVGLSDESNTYPFAGYKAVLGRIFGVIMEKGACDVLDIGFGTGTLTAKLYENGCRIWGQDFSEKMIGIAREKMPGAQLFAGDFSLGLTEALQGRKYDFIVSTYALHHLTSEGKTALINELYGKLTRGGMVLIGDIAFENSAELEKCRAACGDEWDDDEIYFTYDGVKRHFPEMTF